MATTLGSRLYRHPLLATLTRVTSGRDRLVVTIVVGVERPSVVAWRGRCGVPGEDVDVNVKTNTRSNSGLDHMTRCALLIEGRVRLMVHRRYRHWGAIANHESVAPF